MVPTRANYKYLYQSLDDIDHMDEPENEDLDQLEKYYLFANQDIIVNYLKK